ncbi:MAG TPA: phage holin family protein [Verrucomicrobiota bacterium]|nr:phage holin family protein [Verrucomicrobiota bacterium]HNT16043.1 phage holin family protein [Verrucomicrobiota bacterium]
MNSEWKKFFKTWLINAFAVLVAVTVLRPHLECSGVVPVFVAALLLGLLNAFIRPLMLFFALPLLVFTLGFFTIIINACLLYFVKAMMSVFGMNFVIEGFGWAMLGAIIISVVSLLLNLATGSTRATVKVRRPHSSGASGRDGGGPVIDV